MASNEILSVDDLESAIVIRNRNGGQIGRLFFSYTEKSTFDACDAPFVCIIRLYVDPKYRRQGIASFMLNRLISKFSCNYIVDAYPDDKEYMSSSKLLKFYNSFGFKEDKRTDDGMRMIKRK